MVCVPGFNCYSCPAAVGACPLGSLQNALASSGNRIGFYVFGIIMLWGLTLGRTICGWLCPMGLIQELLHKIPTPKIRKNRITYYLSYLKYFFLLVFAIAIPLWYGLKHQKAVPGFCKYICPAGTLEGGVFLVSMDERLQALVGGLFSWKMLILVLVIGTTIFIFRSFCRFVCPLGAFYGLFHKVSVIGMKVDENRCNGCNACVSSCKMDVEKVGDAECIQCGECKRACNQCAISMGRKR